MLCMAAHMGYCNHAGALLAQADSDKVRANAVRAVGSVLAAVSTKALAAKGQHGNWLPDALQFVHSCGEKGSGKVQWNACVAIRSLLQNEGVAHAAMQGGWLAKLLQLLKDLLIYQSNFKVSECLASCSCMLAAWPSEPHAAWACHEATSLFVCSACATCPALNLAHSAAVLQAG